MNNFNALSDLVADAEELLSKLGQSASPEIRELKSRVESSLGEMKEVFRGRIKKGGSSLRGVTATAVNFAKHNSSVSIGLGLAVAVTVICIMRLGNHD